ncbi:MAG TPA: hypothetical protein VKN18_28470 [Blastocatellia bacterium]|nr:hypothetical protein [Blastocatellia bacterium]
MTRRRLSQESLKHKQDIVAQYRAAHENRPATAVEIADWAIQHELWKPHLVEVRRHLAELLAQAMREEYITDPQSRRVRAKHAAHVDQGVLWIDIRDKRPETRTLLEISFQNRRQQIVGDCRQLKNDIDSYNQNYNDGEMIQSCFDFTDDLAELELAKTAKAAQGITGYVN